jgi:hypothetical protein
MIRSEARPAYDYAMKLVAQGFTDAQIVDEQGEAYSVAEFHRAFPEIIV